MNRVSKVVELIWQYIKQCFARFLVSFNQLPVSIARVYHAEDFCQDMIVLQLVGTKLTLQLPVQELAEDEITLNQMHPLEATLVKLLAIEEFHNNGHMEVDLSATKFQLSNFACVDKQFFCDRTKKIMVVISPPWHDQQLCLPINVFANEVRLLAVLKSLSWVPETPVMFNGFEKPANVY